MSAERPRGRSTSIKPLSTLVKADHHLPTSQTSVNSKARYTIRIFGIRHNEKIAVHAEEILECGLKVKEYELPVRRKNFSDTGNFWFRY